MNALATFLPGLLPSLGWEEKLYVVDTLLAVPVVEPAPQRNGPGEVPDEHIDA
jgi:hypothetical protein